MTEIKITFKSAYPWRNKSIFSGIDSIRENFNFDVALLFTYTYNIAVLSIIINFCYIVATAVFLLSYADFNFDYMFE